MTNVQGMQGTQGYKHTLGIFNTYCFSPATMVTRMCLDVMLYIHCLPHYDWHWNLNSILSQNKLNFQSNYIFFSLMLYISSYKCSIHYPSISLPQTCALVTYKAINCSISSWTRTAIRTSCIQPPALTCGELQKCLTLSKTHRN
jgi:hypothetical protein